jgi:hypothetical protein
MIRFLCFTAVLATCLFGKAAELPGNAATSISPVELTSFDVKMLDSANGYYRSKIPFYILVGLAKYEPVLGDMLAVRYQAEKDATARLVMLAVLHKYKHPSVSTLLEETKVGGNRDDQEIAKLIESGGYSNILAPATPEAHCEDTKRRLKHLDEITPPLLLQVLFTLRYNARGCGYDDAVGDTLADFFLKHPGADLFQIRVGIALVLLNESHIALPKLVEGLEGSPNVDDRELAAYLQSQRRIRGRVATGT